jgi:outer membrane immunogenic protein
VIRRPGGRDAPFTGDIACSWKLAHGLCRFSERCPLSVAILEFCRLLYRRSRRRGLGNLRYVDVHRGSAGRRINSGTIAAFNAAGPQSIKPGSFIGGFDGGYNWQVGNYLAGVEGDIEWLHLSGSAVSGPLSFVPPPGTFTISSNADIDWLATLRGRLGFTSGNWLFYATGGAAFTTLHGNFQFSETFFNSAETASVSAAKTGYTVGGGVETYLWQHWSVKAEYLFVDFGNVSAFGVDTGVPFPFYSFTHSVNLKLNIARLGLNYHF